MRFLSIGFLLFFAANLQAAEEVDLSDIPKQIDKAPKFNADDPLYGLMVFGPEAKTRVWMALDKSDAKEDVYDVLYADLNANGALTEPGEKIAAESASVSSSRFRLPDFTDPASGAKHTDITFRATRGQQPTFMIGMQWRGKLRYGGGYATQGGEGYMRFAESPAEAPIVWMNGDGPFRFQRWYSEEFRIGKEDDLKVFLGQEGVGANSFTAFQCHALPPGEAVLATLIYRDQDGKQRQVDYKLKERC